jgi:hypothetical protein
MMNYKLWLRALLLFTTLSIMNVAQSNPDLFPGMQPMEGTVGYMDLKSGEMVVDDTSFQLNDRTTVRKTSGAFVSLVKVRVGSRVKLYLSPEQLNNFTPPIYISNIELR